ncbi:bifunctional [glutamine synthetase] adenylyltransferase/[glutamine synthetase]-adenylyl-L-tyrosine phosphorylase [Chelatococcus sp. SYSU_G07232]|uniref:Bifunctional glutamine synthetase adenylyltransferase/adenylyl-removing enzyme n=1 Tax=Chelatococcus albus TaxID=3047466 RepID=A0ABT7AHY6_9HYPH|nr:bifunctional [glutamine synthetase] adenylyltransferase/[glutamine synthetase]-adenylyl-L-tyrosine phosphorylase [Chelatococcus sp. SYSU_G07232]MDJ1159006.1 bifunctional [glutamine synthetase] adenylyltransferase/[glutamine synthetase]-adenylyl-L-tyrosine phosphorylase [Chelatococcus sp. SYSU_G07232]
MSAAAKNAVRETATPAGTSLAARITAAPLPADPREARRRLADLLAEAKGEGAGSLTGLLAEATPARALLLGLADQSPFLWRIAHNDVGRLERLLTTSPEESLARIVATARDAWRSADDTPQLMRALRRLRAEQALLVALADCGGAWGVEPVTEALSAFADASVGSAVRFLLKEAAAAGRFSPPDADDPEQGSGLVVLALGKHGAGELNYSSDIDLVVFYDPAAPVAEHLEASTFFVRLTQGMAKILQERNADGYVFRTDLRLRPDPGSTSVAVSLPAAFTYYETVGQNWERAALIKARPIAGDIPLAERFLADLRPFIWRKYFDFAAIADIHAMKRQIHAVRGHEAIAVAGHDIKLGRGGIREIEFFVQTQQLVFGGRRPDLRGRRTLDMLERLCVEGWITDKARDELAAAYRFLRTVEHRLQMVADEQTQRLPAEEEALERFARFCGFRTARAFGTALTKHARAVQRHYALLFEEGPELAAEAGNLVFTGTADDPETVETLRRMGFTRPERTTETVRGWHFGRRPAVTSARAREVLTELTPGLLAALGRTADPDGALSALDEAFGRMPAAVELLSILRSNDELLRLFADLLGGAPRLAEIVASSPHVLDAVIDPTFLDPTTQPAEIEARVRGLVGEPASFEDFLDRIREAARQETFLTGARLLSGVLTPGQAGEAYAAVAEAVIRASFDAVLQAFAAEHGRVPGARAVVLGLGRLGAREMTAASDLDLVVLYDFDPERSESDGPRPLDAVVYYTRLTQRLVSALTVPTRRGRLYEVDMRLRPSGRKGPVATQFRGFLAYQSEEAETWEHMALTRARVVAGDAAFAEEARAAIAAVVGRERDPGRLARDIRDMRALIAAEKGDSDPWDLKLVAGGLVDLEFLAQFLVLAHAAKHPEIAVTGTGRVLARAVELGLIAPGDGETLRQAYQQISDVFHWQRLTVEGRFDPAAVAPAVLRRIAGAIGLPDGKVLARHLDDTRAKVREACARLMPTDNPARPARGKGRRG